MSVKKDAYGDKFEIDSFAMGEGAPTPEHPATHVYLAIGDDPEGGDLTENRIFKRKKFIRWIAKELGLYVEDALHPETTGYFNNESGERA